MRFAVGALSAAVLAVIAGCGGGDNSAKNAGRDSPDQAQVVLTVLNYGRTASAAEVCPLLSKAFVDRITNGDASKCATAGGRILCPCTSERLAISTVSVNGDKAKAVATRPGGKTVTLTLVHEGGAWKIDSLDRQV
jgi:hypothetical protein